MDGSGKQTQSPRDFQETMDPFYTAKPLFKGELVRDYQVEIKKKKQNFKNQKPKILFAQYLFMTHVGISLSQMD